MSNRRSSTLKPFAASASSTRLRCRFLYSFFSRKKLSKMVVETRSRSPHCVVARGYGNAHVAFARDHGADAASEDAKKGRRRKRRDPRGPRPDRGEAPRATRNRATARRHEASRCPAAGGCSCITSGSSRRSRSGGTTSACRSLTSRGAVVAHPTSSSRVARRCRLNARAFPRPTRAADLFERLARPDLRTRARRTAAETTSSGDPNTERDAPYAARA